MAQGVADEVKARARHTCPACGAEATWDPGKQALVCGFCGATALVPYEEVKQAFSPESLLPMKISGSKARELIKSWYGSRWFAPNKLKKAALTDTVKGLYIPYWTFDARANADWEAEAGYYRYGAKNFQVVMNAANCDSVRPAISVPSVGVHP